jgi:hypothetical protein
MKLYLLVQSDFDEKYLGVFESKDDTEQISLELRRICNEATTELIRSEERGEEFDSDAYEKALPQADRDLLSKFGLTIYEDSYSAFWVEEVEYFPKN